LERSDQGWASEPALSLLAEIRMLLAMCPLLHPTNYLSRLYPAFQKALMVGCLVVSKVRYEPSAGTGNGRRSFWNSVRFVPHFSSSAGPRGFPSIGI